ncbi:MAG: hypothetical protein J6B39_08990 [Lachnospiraceae bacterium]|nr:hypothetical protein [Lachnospiraceae bacterium]
MRKKRIMALAFVVALLITVGCGDSGEFKAVSDGLRYAETYQIASIAEEGVFFEGKDGLVWFRPTGETEAVVLCYDPNCTHQPVSPDNPDPTCRAAMYDARTDIAYYEGNLYFFVDDGVFSHKIYRMAVDGPGRECIAEIPYFHNVLQGVTFYEDRMYYSVYSNTREADGSITSMPYLLEYNLKDGKYRLMTEESRDIFMTIQATENYVFLRMISNSSDSRGDVYLKRVNVNTLEDEVLISPADYKKNSFVRAYDDDNYIYYEFYDTVGMRNISTGKDRVLIDETGNGEIGLLTASGNGIFYCLGNAETDGNPKITGYYFYDMITEKTKDISDKGFEYGPTSYDGFSKVFITGALHDIKLISEDEILK